jgi:hypothetical protein
VKEHDITKLGCPVAVGRVKTRAAGRSLVVVF